MESRYHNALLWFAIVFVLGLNVYRLYADAYGRDEWVFRGTDGRTVTLTYDDVVAVVQIQRHAGLDRTKLDLMKGLDERPLAVEYWREQDKRTGDKPITPRMEELQSLGLVEQNSGLWALTLKGRNVIARP